MHIVVSRTNENLVPTTRTRAWLDEKERAFRTNFINSEITRSGNLLKSSKKMKYKRLYRTLHRAKTNSFINTKKLVVYSVKIFDYHLQLSHLRGFLRKSKTENFTKIHENFEFKN